MSKSFQGTSDLLRSWETLRHFVLGKIQITLWGIVETLESSLGNMGTQNPLAGPLNVKKLYVPDL